VLCIRRAEQNKEVFMVASPEWLNLRES